MAKIRENRVKFSSEKLVLTAGATPANEILMFCLANPGEAFILPTPYYPGYVSLLFHLYQLLYYYVFMLDTIPQHTNNRHFKPCYIVVLALCHPSISTLFWQVR